MIQQVVINLLTKYDHSRLHSYGEIFDEKFHSSKYGRKENWTNTGRISRGLALNLRTQQAVINIHTKYDHG